MAKIPVEEMAEGQVEKAPVPAPGISVMQELLKVGEFVPPWWSKSRDTALMGTWMDGGVLSGVMAKAAPKLANIPFKVVAKDETITRHVDQAARITESLTINSEFGAGISETMLKTAQDYLGQDNGMFLELMDGVAWPKKDTPLVGIPFAFRALDAQRCTRSHDPIYPVIYEEAPNKYYRLHYTRIIALSQLPSSRQRMNGVGLSSVSRSILIAQRLSGMVNYVLEQQGSRPLNQILFGKMMSAEDIITAVGTGEAIMDQMGLQHYARTIAFGADDPEASLERIKLNDFQPFDEEKAWHWGLILIANAWGLEYHEMFPQMGGTKASELASMYRSKGMMPSHYLTRATQQINYKALPEHLQAVMDYQDDMEDQQTAIAKDIRTRMTERGIRSGVLTRRAARREMLANGDISRSVFDEMMLADGYLPDGKHIATAFFDKVHGPIIGDAGALVDVQANAENYKAALAVLSVVKAGVMVQLAEASGSRNISILQECVAALEWLEDEYKEEGGKQQAEEMREPQMRSYREPDQNQGESENRGKAKELDANYLDAIDEQVREAFEMASSEDDLGERILAILIAAALFGAGVETFDDLPDYVKEKTNDLIALIELTLADVYLRAQEGDAENSVEIASALIGGIYLLGDLHAGSRDEILTWRRDPTKDSCVDCVSMDGTSRPRSEWLDMALERGIYPRSPLLACTGRHCGCRLERA